MSDIPTDIYGEILRRVPVDALYQFRSVCKSWREIIDDPQFVKQHMHHGIGNRWIILFHEFNGTSSVFLLPLKHLICPEPTKWVYTTNTRAPPVARGVARIRHAFPYPSCNGLILITPERKNIAWVIWNPFTSQSLELPLCDELTVYEYGHVPRGFGYVEATDDYKVVIIIGTHTYIYSVNLGAWRRVQDFPKVSRITCLNGASTNGVLHWIAINDYSVGHDSGLYGIVALDLNKEAYSKIPFPSDADAKPHCSWSLEELDGCLFLSPHLNGRFVLWMVDNYNGSDDIAWIKIMSIRVEHTMFSSHEMTPVAYLKSENRLLLRYPDWTLTWYDLVTQCLSKVSMEVNLDEHDHLQNPKFVPHTQSFQVIPASLIRLKSDGTSSSKRKRKRVVKKFGLKGLSLYFDV